MTAVQRSAVRTALIALIALALAVEPAASQVPMPAGDEPELAAQAGPKKHRRRQRRPILMGTSGGNINDFTIDLPFIFCCSGTLGSLVRKGDQYFILSNNHVLAMVNKAKPGDDINQPGMLDNRCRTPEDDFVAQLSGFKKIKLNRGRNQVDAAIAEVLPGMVDLSGEIIDIGVPGNETVNPTLGMEVRKGGRTTGVRTGVVDALNVAVRVQYPEDCSDDPDINTGLFVKQIIIVPTTRKPFSQSGDSGSLVVENVEPCPRQVGLLFAGGVSGSQSITVASRMSTVMKQVKKMKPKGPADLVGCDPQVAAGAKLAARGGVPEIGERELRLAERIQARAEAGIMALEGVHAMGIGRSSSRPQAPVFKVYVDDRATRIPAEIEGIPVEVVVSGPIRARNCRRARPASPPDGHHDR